MAIECIKGDGWKTLAKPGKLNDGGGLWLDVRSATSASWLFRYTFGQKADEVGLGSRAKVDIERARELRVFLTKELAQGRNPKEVLRAQKLETVRVVNSVKTATIAELIRDNIRTIAPDAKSERVQQAWINSLQFKSIGRLARMLPHEVTREDCRQLLQGLYTGEGRGGKLEGKAVPVHADDIRQRIAAVLSWAKARDLILAPDWENPCRWDDNLRWWLDRGEHVEKNHTPLPSDDLNAFLAKVAAADEYMPTLRACLAWHVISITRPAEATGARWEELDLRGRVWVIPAERTKMRREHWVPLTDAHFAILDKLAGGTEYPETGFIFPGRKKGEPVSVTGVRRMMHNAYGKEQTLHGFRGTFATWAREQMQTVTLPGGREKAIMLYTETQVEESLAHIVGNKVRNAYTHSLFLEQRRGLIEDYATYCLTERKAAEGTVIPFRTRKAA